MDDIQLVLYIIFVIVAILVRAFKSSNKKPPAPSPTRPDQSSEVPPKKKPMSFEDLLKEFETASEPGSAKKEEPVESQESYEFESESPSEEEIQRVYEDSLKQSKKFKTIDELVELETDDRHTGDFHHFRGYDQDEATADEGNEFVKLLQNAEGAKKAIILSEIINRKY